MRRIKLEMELAALVYLCPKWEKIEFKADKKLEKNYSFIFTSCLKLFCVFENTEGNPFFKIDSYDLYYLLSTISQIK